MSEGYYPKYRFSIQLEVREAVSKMFVCEVYKYRLEAQAFSSEQSVLFSAAFKATKRIDIKKFSLSNSGDCTFDADYSGALQNVTLSLRYGPFFSVRRSSQRDLFAHHFKKMVCGAQYVADGLSADFRIDPVRHLLSASACLFVGFNRLVDSRKTTSRSVFASEAIGNIG